MSSSTSGGILCRCLLFTSPIPPSTTIHSKTSLHFTARPSHLTPAAGRHQWDSEGNRSLASQVLGEVLVSHQLQQHPTTTVGLLHQRTHYTALVIVSKLLLLSLLVAAGYDFINYITTDQYHYIQPATDCLKFWFMA
eukprot:6213991-Amphidinium_carterae.2